MVNSGNTLENSTEREMLIRKPETTALSKYLQFLCLFVFVFCFRFLFAFTADVIAVYEDDDDDVIIVVVLILLFLSKEIII